MQFTCFVGGFEKGRRNPRRVWKSEKVRKGPMSQRKNVISGGLQQTPY